MERDGNNQPFRVGRGFTALRWRRPAALFMPLGVIAGSFGGVALLMEGLLMYQAKAVAPVSLTMQQIIPGGIIMLLILGTALLTLRGRQLSMENFTGMTYLVGISFALILFLVVFAAIKVGGLPPEAVGVIKGMGPQAKPLLEKPDLLAMVLFAAMVLWLLVQCALSAILVRYIGMVKQRD